MKIHLSFIFVFLLFTSCKVNSFDQPEILPSQPLIGTVGKFQESFSSSSFKEAGVAKLDDKIRLSFRKEAFNKKRLKLYNEKTFQKHKKLEIIDSVNIRPFYYIVEISDKIELIKAINSEPNKEFRKFLKFNSDHDILTSMEIYFPPELSIIIDNSLEIYLVNDKKSSYSFEILNQDKTKRTIEFGDGVSFRYGFSSFCWGENFKGHPEIVTFQDRNGKCSKNTYSDPEELESKDSELFGE